MVGFTNVTGHWFVFENRKHLMPRATVLTIEVSYGSLVHGHKKLAMIDLGKQDALQAANYLASLHTPPATNHQKLQLESWLAKLCVMVAEAERFNEIFATVSQGWGHQLHASLNCRQREWSCGVEPRTLFSTGTTTGSRSTTTRRNCRAMASSTRTMQPRYCVMCLLWPAGLKLGDTVDPQTELCN